MALIFDQIGIWMWLRVRVRGGRKANGKHTSFRHFWLRIAYSNLVMALSFGILVVLRRLASLAAVQYLWCWYC